MASVTVELLDQGRLDELTRLLAGFSKSADTAIANAQKRAVSHLRTNSTKKIQERYDISSENIRTNQNISVKYSYADGIEATVTFAGRKIPLYRYGGSYPKTPTVDKSKMIHAMMLGNWRTIHPGVAARGHELKGTAVTTFESAFVARMASGHVGIFDRTGGETEAGNSEIKEIMGSSVAQMVGNEQVREALADEYKDKFIERLDHEVLRIMNGWE